MVGFEASLYLVLPLSGRPLQHYVLAIALAIDRAVGIKTTRIVDIEIWTQDPINGLKRLDTT